MNIQNQLKNAAPILVMVYAFTTAVLSVVILLGIEHNIELDHFTQDPASIMDTPFYLGFFSYIGILFWCGSAMLCFFSNQLLAGKKNNDRIRSFMLYSGLISTLLMFDDLFLMHEVVLPEYFSLPRGIVYVIYVNIIILYFVLFRTELVQSEYIVLLAATALIAISQFVDELPMPIPEDSFLEDAVKLFGIVTWFTYYARYCFQKMKTILG